MRQKIPLSTFSKILSCWLIAILAAAQMGLGQQTPAPPQPAQNTQQPVEAPIPGQPTLPPVNPNELPNNPAPQQPVPQNTSPALAQRPAQSAGVPQQPTGTAAAQAEKPAGSAASRPAGAAIAPPKQRQIRSFLIKMGVIAGAGIALGTVYALSVATPSRVPGSPAAH